MNLKVIHIVFVTCSVLLAGLFGGWSFAQGGAANVAVSLGSFLVAVGLVVYGRWFWRKVITPEEERRRRRKLIHPVATMLVATAALWPRAASACTTCYGAAEGPMIDSARSGVFVLLGIVVAVQIAFASFFLYLRRRARNGPQVPPWWSTIGG
jgi:amino acid transporter